MYSGIARHFNIKEKIMFYDIDLDIMYYACLTHMELLCFVIIVIIFWEIVKKLCRREAII